MAADGPAPAVQRLANGAQWPALAAAAALMLAAPAFAFAGWFFLADAPVILFYAVPVVAVELAVIILAIVTGFDLRASFAALAPTTRLGAGLWIIAAATASLIIAADPAAAYPLLFSTIVHAVFGLALCSLMTATGGAYRRTVMCAAGAGVLLYAAVFTTIVLVELRNPAFNWIGVGIGITNIRQLGFFGLALSCISLGLSQGLDGKLRAIAGIGAAAGFWLTILSGSRVAFAAAILVAIALCTLVDRQYRLRFAGLALAALAVAMPASYLLVPHEAWGLDRILSRGLIGDDINQYSSGRLAIWRDTLAAIGERPLFGHGEGQFRSQVAAAGGGLNHPHNAVLQFLYQWGIVGTAGLALMLSASAMQLRRLARHAEGTDLAAFGTLAGLVAIAMLEGALYHTYPVMIAVLCLAVLNAGAPRSETRAGETGAGPPQLPTVLVK
ncbi:O-antigen ligase family protein [Pelagerythrobacter marensis]|uniref:O-antigen ligase-related domain-containing protein n=1 Tax=Pelagerythrobacter marensis TaxID=543877 RepID=A0A0G3XAB8_9SPHN|nr:O-antigen ligase family protein [Pelagerythrobacter marensis]AKM07524.1 hypothetical protein AM2010_1454 [Pelagerythrobacter marensis]